jgi:hypothetical protein
MEQCEIIHYLVYSKTIGGKPNKTVLHSVGVLIY